MEMGAPFDGLLCVTRKFDVLVLQNSAVVVQRQRQLKDKKRAARANLFFLLIRKKSVLHVQFVFLLIRSIDLDAIFIALNLVPRVALPSPFRRGSSINTDRFPKRAPKVQASSGVQERAPPGKNLNFYS